MTRTNIIISFQLEGFHQWNDAFDQVKFLRDDHRHMFHFELEVPIKHDDRDIEIILFKRQVQSWLKDQYGDGDGVLQFGLMSCESIAKQLLIAFDCDRVKVTEDGENGAVIYRVA